MKAQSLSVFIGKDGRATVCLSLAFLLVTLQGMAWSQERVQNRLQDQYQIKASVELVVLYMSVRTRHGDIVSGLKKDNFQVYEDGVPQEIESFNQADVPVTVGLVIDNSGSMAAKRPEVNTAAMEFARSSNPEDEMFVVSFNENVSFGLPRNQPFTNRSEELQKALTGITAQGKTALYDAISSALQHLKRGARDKKALIVISDGGDNASSHTLSQVTKMAVQSDAIIFTVGLFDERDPDRNPRVLKELARLTGGEAFFPGSLEDVVPICDRIALDIRSQYTATYIPTNRKQDGTFRSIEVKASAPGYGRLRIRTRAGYYAPSSSSSAASEATEHESPN
jgi:Ca-activated chloride channel family protein